MSTDTRDEALAALKDMRDRAWKQAEFHARANQDSAAERCRDQFNALGLAIAALAAPVEAAPPAGVVEDAALALILAARPGMTATSIVPNPKIKALADALAENRLATPAARQYYYRVNACKAANHKALDCLCWHDEGTGPLADTPKHIREWRTKPAARQGGEACPECHGKGGDTADGDGYADGECFACCGSGKAAALSARPAAGDGEAVAWAQIEDDELVGLSFKRTEAGGCTTPLFTAPPAREGVPEGTAFKCAGCGKDAGDLPHDDWQCPRCGCVTLERRRFAAAPTAGEGSKDD